MSADAFNLAKDAHENHFHSHRGTWPLADEDDEIFAVAYYDNHPYVGDVELRAVGSHGTRDAMLRELRVWMATQSIPEMGFASYPTVGDDAGYTVVIILGTDRVEMVKAKLEELVKRHMAGREN